jgi:pimeloyl-ACP methyl ester carboxylesterase
VWESGRAYCELVFWFLDSGKAAAVDFAAVTTPVLAIRGEYDHIAPLQVAAETAARCQKGTCVQIPRADHLVFFGDALPVTMGHIDDWIARNQLIAPRCP